jgi:hypothetical protein
MVTQEFEVGIRKVWEGAKEKFQGQMDLMEENRLEQSQSFVWSSRIALTIAY